MASKPNIDDVKLLQEALATKLEAITKDMVEDVLTGEIDSHTHAQTEDSHTHENKTILDDIEESLTSDLKTNYDNAYTHSQSTHAPSDAEANVQADWFEINDSYDSFIKNKPHILRYIGKLESSSDIDLRLKEEGIYTLCMGTKYLFAPNLYCGTDEYSTQLSGHLTVCKPDGNGATMTYHDFHKNIVYVASAVNGAGNVLLWNDWKRLLTCRDEIIEDLEETEEFSYEIGSSYQRISLNGNDIKGRTILIDLKNFNSQPVAKLRIVILISPASPNPDIQIIDSSNTKQINYSLSYYTIPSNVSSNVFLIEYEIYNLIPYWLVSNKIYY